MRRGEYVVVCDETPPADVMPLSATVVAQGDQPGHLEDAGGVALVRQADHLGNAALWDGEQSQGHDGLSVVVLAHRYK